MKGKGKLFLCIVTIIVTFSCSKNTSKNTPIEKWFPPKEVKLDTINGYVFNQLSLDSNKTVDFPSGKTRPFKISSFRNDFKGKNYHIGEIPIEKSSEHLNFIKEEFVLSQEIGTKNESTFFSNSSRKKIRLDTVSLLIDERKKLEQKRYKFNFSDDIGFWNAQSGLSDESLYSMIQIENGDFLIGHNGGLSEFDGRFVRNYTRSDGIAFGLVIKLILAKDNTIWIATNNKGAYQFDGKNFHLLNEENGLPSNYLNDIYEDKKGNIWLLSSEGAAKYDGTYLTNYTTKDGLKSNNVLCMLNDSKDNYWFCYRQEGVSKLSNNQFEHFTLENKNSTQIQESPTGQIWFGHAGSGVTVWDKNQFKTLKHTLEFSSTRVRDFHFKNDKVFFSTFGHGLIEYSTKEHTITTYKEENGLPTNFLWFIFEDKQENLWIGSVGAGLIKFNQNSIKNIPPLFGQNSNDVWAIKNSKDSTNLFFSLSTLGKGIVKYDVDKKSYQKFSGIANLSLGYSSAIEEDNSGNLWCVPPEYGVVNIKKTENELNEYEHFTINDGLRTNYSHNLLKDLDGNIWISSQEKGLSKIILNNNKNKQLIHFDDSSGTKMPRGAICDKKNNIWVGTEGEGLLKIKQLKNNTYKVINYTTQEGVSSNTIYTLYLDKKNRIWLGTGDKGLCVFDGSTFKYITEEEGLSSNGIRGIDQDNQGRIWVTTARGLNCVIENEKGKFNAIHFTERDGLINTNFLLNSIAIDKNNILWIGSSLSMITVDLNKIKTNSFTQIKSEIERIFINNKPLEFGSLASTNHKKELPFDQNEIQFDFNSSPFSNLNQVEFSFRLLGAIDEKWSFPNKENRVIYRNMSPGKYKFELKSRENGKWGKSSFFSFTIRPPWWKSNWALFTYFGVFLLISYWFYRFTLERKLKIEEANQLKEVDRIKTNFFTNISHEFRTPLTLINGMTSQLKSDFEKKDDQNFNQNISILNRNSSQLLHLVNQLLDLSKLDARKKSVRFESINIYSFVEQYAISYSTELERKKVEFILNCENKELNVYSDKIAFGQIIQNLLSNAVKFTAEGKITVTISLGANEMVEIRVQDSGIGIENDKIPHIFDRFYQADDGLSKNYEGTGIGLALSKELIELLNGSIEVQSVFNEGSTFILKLPQSNDKQGVKLNPVPKTTSPLTNTSKNEPKETNTNRPLLLIVEDNEDVTQYLTQLLENNYSIQLANNGEAGLALATEIIPDFIITDWMMPKMTGPQMLQKLKANIATSHIPVMLLTARADLASKLTGLQFGAEAYLSKPFEPQELHLQIDTLIKARLIIQNFLKQQTKKTAVESEIKIDEIIKIQSSFYSNLVELINSNLINSKLTVEFLSEKVHLSRSQLNRKLKAVANKSCSQLIRELKIKKSKELFIQNKELTISEVAYDSGFSDPSYFSRIFKTETGMSPKEFLEEINFNGKI